MFLQFGQVGQQFLLVGQSREVVADHFVGSKRGLSAGPQADQQMIPGIVGDSGIPGADSGADYSRFPIPGTRTDIDILGKIR